MKQSVTPRQVAEAFGVSEASLKRWCDRGLLPVVRTGGGHRRLPISGVMQFIRDRGQALIHPEILGLPRATGQSTAASGRLRDLVRQAVEDGDEERCARLVYNAYLGGRHVHEIADTIIAPVFHEIGHRWCDGALEVYAERRGIEICTRVLHQLRGLLPPHKPDAPFAFGATLEGDPYSLPTTLVEVCLLEQGWRAQSYGIGVPAVSLRAAIELSQPTLFWLSVSTLNDDVELFLSRYEAIYASAQSAGAAVVVGGRALTEPVRQRMKYSAFCDTLGQFVEFAGTLAKVKRQPT